MNNNIPIRKRSFWKNIFLSPDEPRLRAGWRLVIQTIFLLEILVGLNTLVVLLSLTLRWKTSEMQNLILGTTVELVAVTSSVILARHLLDRRPFVGLGLKLDRWVLPDLLAGIVITFVIMESVYLAMSLLGWVHFTGYAWQFDSPVIILQQVLLYLLIFTCSGWQEELLTRGYHLQTLSSSLKRFWSVVLSSAIFGALHLGNPHASWASVMGIFFAGLFLALGYLCTGQLWLAIGLHIGWNFFEGVVFGFPVSGIASYPLQRITVSGPEILTGGAFGPEAGLIVLPALALGALLVWLYSKWRSNSPSNP